jgi:ankyrin repeat protein
VQGETPLIVATANGHLFDMRLLVAAGCNINAQSADGTTALMSAASMGFMDGCIMLLEYKADVSMTDNVRMQHRNLFCSCDVNDMNKSCHAHMSYI